LWVRFLPGLPFLKRRRLLAAFCPQELILTHPIEKEFYVVSKVDRAKKEEKKVVRKQPNAIVRYFNETIGELRKVSWPTRKDSISLTVIVLIVTFSMSAFLGLLDFLFSRFFALLFT
jgi:preprotein translocase subunit SecE